MGQLVVRGLDDRIIQALERRAVRTGRTIEAVAARSIPADERWRVP